MRRREFIILLGVAAVWPLPAGSQQIGTPTIGFLHPGSPGPNADFVAAFHQGSKLALSGDRPRNAAKFLITRM